VKGLKQATRRSPEARVLNFRQIALVKQARCDHLGRAELLDGGTPQGREVVQPCRFHVLFDPRFSDHAAISHQHDMVKTPAFFELTDLAGHGRGIARVALKYFDSDGTPFGVAQQAVNDLP
jgi:hypothetical protein